MWIQSLPEFTAGNWMELVRKLRAEYRGSDCFRQMETVEFLEAYIRQCISNPPGVREYCRQFILISQRVTEAGNLENGERGYWFVKGLPFEYRRHAMAKTGADPDRRSSFDFCQLLRAVESKIMATENAERMTILPHVNMQEMQLIQEIRQQRNELNCGSEKRLLGPVSPDVHKGTPTQQQSPSTDQEIDEMAAARGPAQGYGPAPEYEDWQSRTRPPQDSQYPQDLRYPQDSTAFGRPQQDVRGQQGTRGQGRRTCFRCGGGHRFTEYKCQGLRDLIQ